MPDFGSSNQEVQIDDGDFFEQLTQFDQKIFESRNQGPSYGQYFF